MKTKKKVIIKKNVNMIASIITILSPIVSIIVLKNKEWTLIITIALCSFAMFGILMLIYQIFLDKTIPKEIEKEIDENNIKLQIKIGRIIFDKIKEERYYRGGIINHDNINSDKALCIKEIINKIAITENEAEKIVENYMGFNNISIL